MKVYISYPPFRDKGCPMWTQNRQFQWYNIGSHIFPVVSGRGPPAYLDLTRQRTEAKLPDNVEAAQTERIDAERMQAPGGELEGHLSAVERQWIVAQVSETTLDGKIFEESITAVDLGTTFAIIQSRSGRLIGVVMIIGSDPPTAPHEPPPGFVSLNRFAAQ